MNMNLMAEKNFVVVELGFKKNVKGAIVAHEKVILWMSWINMNIHLDKFLEFSQNIEF